MATLTGKLVAETYQALLKTINNDVITASEVQISDGFGQGTNVFLDQNGFVRASKYKVTGGNSGQFLKADGSLDSTSYLPTGSTTSVIPEGTNKYFTELRVLNSILAGFTPISGTVSSTDSVLTALEKIWFNILNGGGGGGGGYVPYLGATQNLNLGTYGLISDFVQLNNAPDSLPTTAGTMYWDDANGTVDVILKGGNYIQRIGQDLPVLVKKDDNSGLEKGKVVYSKGSDGSNTTVLYAQANAEATSSKTFGVLVENKSGGSKGYCVTFGYAENIDTSALTEGATVYLSGSVAGGMTTTKPQAPTHLVTIGRCIRQHATQGVIFVTIQNGFEFDELHDVQIVSKQNNQVPVYSSSDSLWHNRTIIKTNGYIPYFDSTDLFKDSPLFTDGTKVGIGTSTFIGTNKLTIAGGIWAEEATINDQALISTNTLNGDFYISRWSGTAWDVFQTYSASKVIFSKDIEATKFIKTGGLHTQFLMADGLTETITNLSIITGGGSGGTNDGYLTRWNGLQTIQNSLMYETSAGFIGFGTTSPFKKFTVQGGAISVYSSSTNYGFMDTSNNSYTLTSANGFNFTANNLGTVATTRVEANGNWGFGVGTPSYKVDVNGDVNTNGLYRVNGSQISTSNVLEGTNLYFTSNRVLGQVLTGLNPALAGTMTATDSLIEGLSKVQYQLNNKENTITAGTTAQYWRGDKTWQTLNASSVGATTVGGNLFTLTNPSAVTFIRINADNTISTLSASAMLSALGGQTALTNPITGTGTTNYLPKFTGSTTLGNSLVYDDGTNIGIGTTTPARKLTVKTTGIESAIYIQSDSNQASTLYFKSLANAIYTPAAATNELRFYVGSTDRMTIDSSGNLGLGVTPSAWTTSFKAFQIGNRASIFTFNSSTTDIGNNTYFSTTLNDYTYLETAAASFYRQSSGQHIWFNAGSNTAGTAISFNQAMTLGASGNLGIGTTTTTYKVNWSNGTHTGWLDFNSGGPAIGTSTGYLQFWTNGASRATIDTSGNLGLSVTPSAWSGSKAFQLTGGAIRSDGANLDITQNAYVGATGWTYYGTGKASHYQQYAGGHEFYVTNTSGTAGTAISFTQAMTLNASGNLLLGSTATDGYRLQLFGSTQAGATLGITYLGVAAYSQWVTSGGAIAYGLDGASGTTERFRVNSNGTFSIGNTNNTYKLDVSGTIRAYRNDAGNISIIMQNDYINQGNLINFIHNSNGSTTNGYIGHGGDSSGNFIIINNGISALTLARATGAATFSSSVKSTLFEASSAGTTKYHIGYYSGGLNFAETGIADFRLFIKDGGNVGIGTTSPAVSLEVNGRYRTTSSFASSGTTVMEIYNASSNGYGAYIGAASGSNYSFRVADYLNNPLFSILGSGNVGIGTTSPSSQLHATGSVIIGSAPSSVFKFNVNPTGSNFISFWIPTIGGVNSNGIISHGGGGYTNQLPLGYFATQHIFNGEVTGGGAMQVAGDVNISGSFKINGTAIGTGGGGVSGSGTASYIPMWSSSTGLTNSIMSYYTYGEIALGTATNANKLRFARPSDGNVTAAYVGFLTTSNTDFGIVNNSGSGEVQIMANSYMSMKIRWNTIELPNLAYGSTGRAIGELYQDAGGYVRIKQ